MTERSPAVSCQSCGRGWNSAALAEGLRLVGSCPRCGGELIFRDDAAETASPSEPVAERDVAPHLVLGIPRR